ncbi:hypothetical protein BsWGS_23251 [Bradybaena similaris]
MLSNQLLLKSRLGVASHKPLAVPRDTAFGESYRCPWTVAHALNGWSGNLLYKEQTKKPVKKTKADFLQLNRGAVSGAMTTADDVHMFRRVKIPSQLRQSEGNSERPPAKVFKSSDVFGRPNIPTSNIVDLLSGGYQREWLSRVKPEVVKKEDPIDFKQVRPNRASLLRPQIAAVGVQFPPWRSPYVVLKALPRISSFRSQSALDEALVKQSFEAHGREGQRGQGIEICTIHEHQPPRLPDQCQP